MSNRIMSSIFAAAVTVFAWSPAMLAQAPRQIPRTPDGKPNFSGHWENAGDAAANAGGAARTRRPTRAQLARELPLTPWGRERVAYTVKGDGEFGGETGAPEDPRFHQLCGGATSPAALGGPIEISQNPRRLLLAYFGNVTRTWTRQFWIGREHPQDLSDYNPSWMGHSVAKWDGDTLVVDTVGVKGGTLIERNWAAPQSEQLRMVERYQLTDPQTLRVERTFTDPKAYTRPWSNTKVFKLRTDWDELAEDWEVVENHTVCVGGTYPAEDDPWFGK
ncbi:MAG: hypothetical protein ACRD88_18775 [Terriglobia bacterium]